MLVAATQDFLLITARILASNSSGRNGLER